MTEKPKNKQYDAVVIAVAHDCFRELGVENIRKFCKENGLIYDLKHMLSKSESDIRL